MRKTILITLTLMLTTAFGVGQATAAPLKLDAAESVQAFGAASYSIDLESEVKKVQLLDGSGRRMADLMISVDPKDGTLLDFRKGRSAHLSVLWHDDLEGGMIVTDRETGEFVVLNAEPGESNQGEGTALIENHRDDLDFLGALYTDLVQNVFDGEESATGEQGSGLDERGYALRNKKGDTSDVWNPDPTCNGSTQLGFGTSFTANVSLAAARARQDANNKCTNQWCWGCCRFNTTVCRTVLFVTTCTAYGTKCSAPIPCV